jgi:hypothetical protein
MTEPIDRVALAQQLFDKYRVRCFWYSPSDLKITEEMIPFVRKGLRAYGGREGFLESAALRPSISNLKGMRVE